MKKYLGHIPLAIITFLSGYSVYSVITSELAFSYKHYIGIIVVISSLVALFIKPMVTKLLTGIALILATFNFAAFTTIIEYYRTGFSIEGKGLEVKIQPYCLFLLSLFIFLNVDFIKSIFRPKPETT